MKRIISLTLVLMIIMAFAVGCTGTDNGADLKLVLLNLKLNNGISKI